MKSIFDTPRTLWLLALSCLGLWAYMLGARTLVPTDEGRYAEMAREMLATGDWITLRLNGIKYFEKPPLQNWMNALTFAAFGLGEWQARLWTGLNGLFGVFALGYTGAQLYGRRVGAMAALVLASSFYWAGMSQVNSLDMGLSGMMTLSLCALLLAQQAKVSATYQHNAMLLCWAAMALATLSKGLIGIVLPGAVLVLYTLATRDLRLWTRLHLLKGLTLYLLICAPWFVLIAQKNPEHPHFFFIHEHFERFTSGVHKRGGAWWYFFPLLALGILPWITLLAQALRRGWNEASGTFQARKMLLIWAVFLFAFFSISGSKLPGYILPIFPAIALLIALHIENNPATELKPAGLAMTGLGLAGLACLPWAASLGSDPFEIPLYRGYAPWLAAAAAMFVLSGLLAFWFARKAQKDLAVLALALGCLLAGQTAFRGHDAWGRYIAGIEHLPALRIALTTPSTPLYAVGRYEQALPFYLQRTTTLVEFPDEMAFGLQQQPELWIPEREEFVKRWQAHAARGEAAVAIVRNDIFKEFATQGLPMRIIGRDPKRSIIALPQK